MAAGMLTNGKWQITFFAMFVTCLGNVLFYTIYLNMTQVLSVFQFFVNTALFMFAAYQMEKKSKQEFI